MASPGIGWTSAEEQGPVPSHPLRLGGLAFCGAVACAAAACSGAPGLERQASLTFPTNKEFWAQQPAHDIALLNSHDSHETLP